MPKASEISDAAAEWLIRLEGQTTPEIWDTFQSWMDQDPRHRAAFVRLRVAWNRVDQLKTLRPVDGTIDSDLLATTKINPATVVARGLQPLQGKPRQRPEDLVMPDRRRVIATAAAIAATGVFAWFGAYHLGWTTYETGLGEWQKIQLPDGTTVNLNTDTELNARISGSRRDIILTRGEALFHVAHDTTRPFYVTAGGTVIRAVGTAFSVRIRDSEHVDVLVEEGRVAVAPPGKQANFENPSLLASADMVSAGEGANVRRSVVSIHSVLAKDITRKLAWTEGYLAFQGETLADVVQEFNRYNQRQITIADPSIVNLQFGGIFRTTELDSFVATLQHSFNVEAQVGDNKGDIRLFAGSKPP
jgi:transmembrane sensor